MRFAEIVRHCRPLSAGMLATFLFFSAWPTLVSAAERFEFYNGIRGLGMGDCYVLNTNDETALAANPAALGKLRDIYGTIFDPELDLSGHYSTINSASSITDPLAVGDMVSSLKSTPSTYYYARAQAFPSFVAHNFGIGVLVSKTQAGIQDSTTSDEVFHRDDMSLLLGYNLRLWGGRIKIGVTGKVVSRIEMNESAFNSTGQALDDAGLAKAGYLKEGVGAGADAGLILTAPWDYLPSIGAVVHDVGGMTFDKAHDIRMTGTTARPNAEVQDADAAISISPIHSNSVRSIWTFEYKSILTQSTVTDKATLIHFGTELNFSDIFFLRFGYNERYWTAGAEFASERYQLQLASYGKEVGTSAAPVEDRRTVVKASIRF